MTARDGRAPTESANYWEQGSSSFRFRKPARKEGWTSPENHRELPGNATSRLTETLEELAELIGPLFARPEPRGQAMRYVAGLLSKGERKNSWRIAELAGDSSPWRTQRLLNRARWEADAVRDTVRSYVAVHLGHQDGILALEEAGVIKKGTASVAVARQYMETTKQVENCQVRMFATYVAPRGSTLVDHALYLPKSWTSDPARCRKAGVPRERLAHRTKPELARSVLQRVWDADLPIAWVTGDAVYGQDKSLRAWLEAQRISYTLTVPASQPVVTHHTSGAAVRADSLIEGIARNGWHRHKAGIGPSIEGSHPGPREPSDPVWACIRVALRENDTRVLRSGNGFSHTLLIRRRARSPRSTFYLVHAPVTSSMDAMVTATWAQQSSQACLRTAQREVSMDEYEVRNWTAWHRHTVLAELALAALIVSRKRMQPNG